MQSYGIFPVFPKIKAIRPKVMHILGIQVKNCLLLSLLSLIPFDRVNLNCQSTNHFFNDNRGNSDNSDIETMWTILTIETI